MRSVGPSVGRFPNQHPDSPLSPAFAHLRRLIDLHDIGRIDIMDYDEGEALCQILESLSITPDVLKSGEEERRAFLEGEYEKFELAEQEKERSKKVMAEEYAGDEESDSLRRRNDKCEREMLRKHIERYEDLVEKRGAVARARRRSAVPTSAAPAPATEAPLPPLPARGRIKGFFKRLLDRFR
ncbi:hypothetical protein Q8F55_002488 [Vanrija albida]|uniref:Uncharacterized protein n=1 Tax=Vanrija albida TaxID=181172 RepID=A0ABR3QAI0_9TREE